MDMVIAGQILNLARRRRAQALAVRLWCDEQKLGARISAQGRRERFKMTDPAKAAHLAALAPFPVPHDWVLDLDTTLLTAEAAADRVVAELGARVSTPAK
jgi:hypothetical protein